MHGEGTSRADWLVWCLKSIRPFQQEEGRGTGDRPKGAGGAAAPPRKNNSTCWNENRANVSTVMKILSKQKLEVC